MANTRLSDLSASGAVAATDIFYGVQTTGVGGVKTTAAQLKTFMSASPTLVTPTLGVAAGTSLALGGATIGSDTLSVTGNSLLTGPLNVTGILSIADGSAANPVLVYASNPTTGFSLGPSGGLRYSVAGVQAFLLSFSLSFSDDIGQVRFGAASDTRIARDGSAGAFAVRHLTNPQILRWYYTYTNLSNYQRGVLSHGADYVEVAAETAGTGADDLDLRLTPAGIGNISFPGGVLLKTRAALTDGAAASLGTLTNAPAVGDPTKWIPINDNGTTRYIPAW